MKVLQISKHGFPIDVMELGDISKPGAPVAVGLSAARMRSREFMENGNARDRGKDFLGL
jgi:hypothetical protein